MTKVSWYIPSSKCLGPLLCQLRAIHLSSSLEPQNQSVTKKGIAKIPSMLWTNIFRIKTQLHISGNKTGTRKHLYDWLCYPSGVSRCNNGSWKFGLTLTQQVVNLRDWCDLLNEYPMRCLEKGLVGLYSVHDLKG